MDELIKQLDDIQSGFSKFSNVVTVAETAMDKFNISLSQANAEKIAGLADQSSSAFGQMIVQVDKLMKFFGGIKDVFYNALLAPILAGFANMGDASGGFISVLQNVVDFIVSKSAPVVEIVSIIATLVGQVLGGVIMTFLDMLAEIFKGLMDLVGPFTMSKDLIDALVLAFGSLAAGILLYQAYVNAASIATKAWSVAQGVFNAIASINPVGLIIGGIIALIALIGYVIYKTDGWGKQWQVLVQFMQNSWEVVKTALSYAWLRIEDAFMSGYETIMRGWYKVQSLWDKDGASEALAKLDGDAAKRAAEIATAKANLDNAVKATKDGWSWELSWNKKTLGDMLSDTKKVLGISDASAIPGSPVPAPVGKQGKGGDLNNAAANITGGEQSAPQSKGISITIQKLIDQVNIHHEDFVDGVDELQEQVTNALINALNKVQKAY